ncbi:MAG: outer membrane beta-barrel protein [Chitinophagaceae bacterium]|nr:outer membrane beta-barrel protein [Chitinophagaceae bacterium]
MKKIVYLLVFIALPSLLLAQKNGMVKGVLFDSVRNQPIASATISLLLQKDSSLQSFAMSDDQGRFQFEKLSHGKYRLMITHVNYHNKNQLFSIGDSTQQKDFGKIYLADLSQTLQEVVVTAEAPPITMVGDTVQYNAGSFKVAPNSSVEQLLKKLPGVKVDKDGSITAQGEKVKKVLVDGKEFFGNDPKIATRNLPADAVDKVQVFDKLSEQAQLTGFDDGSSQKTVNLKLKKDRNKGMFGRVSAGGGTNDRFEGKLNMNTFQGNRRISLIGNTNNTNNDAFSFNDIMSMTGAKNISAGGGLTMVTLDASQIKGTGNGDIRTIWGGGVNYNDMMGKADISGNYSYNHYNPKTASDINRNNFLGDSSWLYKQSAVTDNINNGHRLNLIADIPLDSFHSIRIAPSINTQDTRNNISRDYQTMLNDGKLVNDGSNRSSDHTTGYTFRNELLFRKKFRKQGRTFSVNLSTNLNAGDGRGTLQSITSFYKPAGNLTGKDTINQRNEQSSNLRNYEARAVYTEPIFRRSLLEFSAGNSYQKAESQKTTWDIDKISKQEQLNEHYSSDYSSSYGTTNAGLRFRTKGKKYEYSLGGTWQRAYLSGTITAGVKDSVLNKTFYNVLPNASFKYSFKQMHVLNLMYRGSTNQPSASQLQPVPDNSDPLNIRLGNPDLKQEFNHMLVMNLNLVNPYEGRSLFVNMVAQLTNNKIVDGDSLTDSGTRITRPVNANGVYNLTGSINAGLPLSFLKGTLNFGSVLNYNSSKQLLNNKENQVKRLTVGPSLRVDLALTDKLDFIVGASVNYNDVHYALSPELNNKYFSQTYESELSWSLPKDFFFSTDFSYMINNRLAEGYNLRVPLWNASVSKQLLKNKRGEIKLSAYDLLDQNVDVSRNATRNYVEDVRSTVLKRYFLLTFTYNLKSMGGPAAGGVQVRSINR